MKLISRVTVSGVNSRSMITTRRSVPTLDARCVVERTAFVMDRGINLGQLLDFIGEAKINRNMRIMTRNEDNEIVPLESIELTSITEMWNGTYKKGLHLTDGKAPRLLSSEMVLIV